MTITISLYRYEVEELIDGGNGGSQGLGENDEPGLGIGSTTLDDGETTFDDAQASGKEVGIEIGRSWGHAFLRWTL
jgi:hypothetical protein